MPFKNYNLSNDWFSQLLVWISASATSAELKSWEGARFPANNFIWTFVEYSIPNDPTSEIVKKEKVLVTWRSDDTITFTRGFGWDTPTSFSWDDFFYLNVVAEIIEDIQDETSRLESDKLNKNW